MRWLTFVLLGILAVSLQTTVAVRLSLGGVRPDFVFILLVHYALHGRDSNEPLAGWILGLMMDLTSVEPLGLTSLVYCLMAVLIWSLRDSVFTRHPLTHFTVTCVCCAVAQLLLRTHFVLITAPARPSIGLFMPSLLMGLYTAAWAVPVHHGLLRFGNALGLRSRNEPVARSAAHAV